jgi:hypothetical protein
VNPFVIVSCVQLIDSSVNLQSMSFIDAWRLHLAIAARASSSFFPTGNLAISPLDFVIGYSWYAMTYRAQPLNVNAAAKVASNFLQSIATSMSDRSRHPVREP